MTPSKDPKAAAREVLREGGNHPHYGDLTEIALDSGYLENGAARPRTPCAGPSLGGRAGQPRHAVRPDGPGDYWLRAPN